MKTLVMLFCAAAALAQSRLPEVVNGRFETRAFSGDLALQIRGGGPTWFGYGVKTARGDHNFNCDTHAKSPVLLEGPWLVAVLFRVSNNAVEKVKLHSIECQLDAGGLPFVWITDVPATASLYYLEKQAAAFDGAVTAIAQHQDQQADAALERFAIDVSGYTVLDAGASTGGFTDCVLQRGASSVVAVDVGHQQLHERLRADCRVEVHERTNVRTWSADALGGRRFDLVVADLSFISLTAVAVPLTCRAVGPLVVLIKPQFEAGRAEVSRGRGVIRSRESWEASLGHVQAAFACSGAAMIGLMVSPITGAEGNVEFLAHFSMVDKLSILASPADVEMPRTERFDAMIQFALDEAARVGTGGHG